MVVLLAGCGGSVKATAEAKPKPATTTTTAADSYVCVQEAESPVPWGDESLKEGMCETPSTASPSETKGADEGTKTVLRNALTALKTYWTDAQAYTGDKLVLGQIEPSLDWDAIELVLSPDSNAVCISAPSSSGKAFAIYDNPYASGYGMGIYYGTSRCPTPVTDKTPAGFSANEW